MSKHSNLKSCVYTFYNLHKKKHQINSNVANQQFQTLKKKFKKMKKSIICYKRSKKIE